MNGRIVAEETPEGRIAAVARSLTIQMDEKYKRQPDYADFRDVLRPFIELELLRARVDEARQGCGRGLTMRMETLAGQMAECERSLPKELIK